jgi:tetratricopeptide (TPR) repeat protein
VRHARPIILAAALLSAAACSNTAGPQGAFERGRAALAEGDARTARIEFLNAIKERPNDAAVRIAQAEAYLALRDGAAAQAELERARKLGATIPDTAHLMAEAYLLQRAHEKAVQEALLAAPAHRGQTARVKGLALMAVGDRAGAASAFSEAQSAAPKDARVWTAFALFRRDNGDMAGALESIDQALALKPADAEALILRGELTRNQYGLRAALPWFDRAAAVDPNSAVALLERAATLGEMGRNADMLADTRKALSLSPNNPRAYYLQAMLAARAGKFNLAQSLYQRTRGALDDQPATMLLAAAIDYQTGNFRQAITRLTQLVGIQPDNLKARRLLAAAHWGRGDAAATAETLQPVVEMEDADRYSLTLMGKALAKQGRTDQSVAYLARAARPQQGQATTLLSGPVNAERLQQLRGLAARSPGDPQAQIRLIRALLSTGLSDEALQRARLLQAGNPGVPDAHVLLGDALATRGDFASAAEQYRRAANLAFTEATAMRLVEALERSGKAEAATKVLELFLEENPRSVPAQLLAANAYMRARDWPAAITMYERLRRRLGDRDALMLNNLAWAYAEQGDYGRAIPLARQAWSLDRANPATADTLGWVLVKSGRNKAEGLMLLERAARGAPTDAAIRQHLSAARGS